MRGDTREAVASFNFQTNKKSRKMLSRDSSTDAFGFAPIIAYMAEYWKVLYDLGGRRRRMDMSFGKHKGKAVALVLLDHPDYFRWMKSEGMTNKPEYQFSQKLITTFDSKPFINARCSGECKSANPVTGLSLYNEIYNMTFWWCDICSPYYQGANPGKLSMVKTFERISGHRDSDRLMKDFTRAKGMPDRRTKKALKDFFGY